MKKSINQFFTVLFIASIFTSCGVDMLNRVNGNRNVVVKERKPQDRFSGIKVSTGIDLYISQGNKNTITVEADENLHDIIITEVKDGVLKIYSDKNIWQAKARKVYVTLENLDLLRATSGSDVYSETTIKTAAISITATSGADIRIEVDAESVETNATSGSDIKISGTSINHASSATSGSSIDAYNLKSNNVIVNASSGADINIYASQKIEAKASSGGDVDFKGNPAKVTKKSSSGGSVSKK
ncbi:head GIN domain-containing protein [uncultured Polaribacter sp.]|uniref:head GIN domain-containing protein n=1 Tax=uncultured Polaribacter sp. TaxID=174711 RepID=UPI00260DD9F6|nr:head GIN domain-containing protein [uncultured Polaribacter sp.]